MLKMRNIALAIMTLAMSACHSDTLIQPVASKNESLPNVTLMTLNVQNLFDNLDDPGKDDKAYLPIADKQGKAHQAACAKIKNRFWRKECSELDWSDDAITDKLKTLSSVIKQVNDGQGPDVIALQEVENENILEQLRLRYLSGLGYKKSILIEGKDNRGIDVAFLSKLPLVDDPVLHPLVTKTHSERAKDTRGVLEAKFEMPDGSHLTGYSVHFPAPFHPTEMRIAAYQHLRTLRAGLADQALVFAAGDFNTTSTEDDREKLLDKHVRTEWEVAHDTCQACPGTYYYAPEDNWSFLDMILVAGTKGPAASWRIRPGSVQLANALDSQRTQDGKPARYRPESKEGASDHWPLILTLERK